MALASVIPEMTSNTEPSGEVTYSGEYAKDNPGWRAFTSITTLTRSNQGWYSSGSNQWVQYQFDVPVEITAVSIIGNNNNNPNVNVLISNNGSDFTNIITIPSKSSVKIYALDKIYTAQYFRFQNNDSLGSGGLGLKFGLYGLTTIVYHYYPRPKFSTYDATGIPLTKFIKTR